MSENYKQLSLEQRYQIEALVKVGMKQKYIATYLKVHPSTISRELRRNTAARGQTAKVYTARIASKRTEHRHKEKRKFTVFDEAMKQHIQKRMETDGWSPELISAVDNEVKISHEWIYQWIWKCKHSNKRKDSTYKNLYMYLKHGKRKRKRGNYNDSRGLLPNRISIENRPLIVAKRERPGDIEVDLMMGKDHKGAILVMTDRATLQTRLTKLKSKESTEVRKGIMTTLKSTIYKVHTLTFDNDKAFACHLDIATKMNLKAFFTRPYTSQDKGTVENRIGVLRRFLPKKTNLTFVTSKMIKQIENKLNNRPIRKFNYLTPNQVLLNKIALIT
jgi:IS30 family transposase